MSQIFIPEVRSEGYKHLARGRNGMITCGPQMAALAQAFNTIAFRRCKLLVSQYTYLGNFPTPSSTFFARFYCSPLVKDVYVVMLIGDAGAPAGLGSYFWTVDGVNQVTKDIANSASASAAPGDFYTQASRFVDGSGNSLAAGVHDVHCTLSATAAITGFAIVEVATPYADTSEALSPDVYSVGSPILGRDLTAMTNRAWLLHRQQGTHHIHWTSNTVGATQTGTTYKNILDGTTTGWAATAAGFWTIPYRQAAQTGTTVPVTMWVYADDGGGAANTGRVRFVNSAGVIATITGIGAAGYYTATGTLDPALVDDLVIIEHSNATGGELVNTYGAGMYAFDT